VSLGGGAPDARERGRERVREGDKTAAGGAPGLHQTSDWPPFSPSVRGPGRSALKRGSGEGEPLGRGVGSGGGSGAAGGGEEGRKAESRRVAFAGVEQEVSQVGERGEKGERGKNGSKKNDTVSL
jgi:hypothetical protein